MQYRDQLEGFLEFLRQAQRDYQIAAEEEREKEAATRGLAHSLELQENSYHALAKISKVMAQVRRERRKAKDQQQLLQPIVEWIAQNTKVINSLEQLLGAVRRAEKSQEGRPITLKQIFWNKFLQGIGKRERRRSTNDQETRCLLLQGDASCSARGQPDLQAL